MVPHAGHLVKYLPLSALMVMWPGGNVAASWFMVTCNPATTARAQKTKIAYLII